MIINGLDVNMRKSYYHKTKVQPDGVTHIIDTEHNYPLYSLGIYKDYFMEDRIEVTKEVIGDLKSLVERLEQMVLEEEKQAGTKANKGNLEK